MRSESWRKGFVLWRRSRSDSDDRLVGERMIGTSQHYLGDQPARGAISNACSLSMSLRDHRSQIIRFQLDPRVTARVLSCADSVAAGVSGSGDARRRTQRRGRSGSQSRNFAVSRSGPGGMPDRALGRRSGRGGTLRRECCSTIRRGTRWRTGALLAAAIRECSSSSAAISSPDCGCCAPASTNSATIESAAAVRVRSLMAEALGQCRPNRRGTRRDR